MDLKNKTIPPIIVIGGSTATGKSAIGISLAKEFGGVIINADSKQIYKELKIGTARPQPEQVLDNKWVINGIDHYLYGHISISKQYDLKRYQSECFSILSQLDPNKPAFLVGGTGLYINSVIYNYDLGQQDKKESSNYENFSISELQQLLGDDLYKLNNSDKNNRMRLIGAIRRGVDPKRSEELNHLFLLIDKPKNILDEQIFQRTMKMFEDGLLSEAEIYKKEILNENKNFNIIGYQEFKEYFENKISLDEVKGLIIRHTIQYAKRQRTWFRNKTKHEKVTNISEARRYIKSFLHN